MLTVLFKLSPFLPELLAPPKCCMYSIWTYIHIKIVSSFSDSHVSLNSNLLCFNISIKILNSSTFVFASDCIKSSLQS